MEIEILKAGYYPIGTLNYCGDGCCSWMEYESEYLQVGETKDFDKIELTGFEEGVDWQFKGN